MIPYTKGLIIIVLLKSSRIFVICQKNAWADKETSIKCLKSVWFRTYSFRTIEGTILYMDRASSHLTEENSGLFQKYKAEYRLILPGVNSYCQSLDLSINKPFKDALREKYRSFCIASVSLQKQSYENMIEWVSDVWWSDLISKEEIVHTFKKGGIILNLNSSEDKNFDWSIYQNTIIIDKISE